MIIRRNIEDLAKCLNYGGVYEFELTDEEIYEAFKLQTRQNHAEDLMVELKESVTDAGAYQSDWFYRKGFEMVKELENRMDKNSTCNESYMYTVKEVVEDWMKEYGINPNEKEGQ